MIHWAWLLVALFVGAGLSIFLAYLLNIFRTPLSPFSDRSIAKMEKMEEKNLG